MSNWTSQIKKMKQFILLKQPLKLRKMTSISNKFDFQSKTKWANQNTVSYILYYIILY